MTQTNEERVKKAVEDIVECMEADWEDFSIDKNGDDDEPTNFIVDPAEFMTEVITELLTQNTADTLARVREERERAERLWNLLDDIDSLPDMIHPNTPEGHEKCWKMMVKISEKRHEVLKTDGFSLTPPLRPLESDKTE